MSTPIFNVNVWDFGERPAAWRDARLGGTANIDPDFWIGTARFIERAGLEGLFLADSPSLNEDPQLRPHRFMEPLAIHATLASHTQRIGLIATVSSSFNDPIELAERAFFIDAFTGGRFGVNVVTTVSPVAARLFGQAQQWPREQRYARAQEFTQVYTAYWAARRAGQAFAFDGQHFQVRQAALPPLDIPARPVILQAGGSGEGFALAARFADAVFSAEMQKDAAIRNRAAIRQEALAQGRLPPKILPGLSVALGSTREEARQRFDHYEQLGPPNFLLRHLNRLLGLQLRPDDLDRPAQAVFDAAEVTREDAGGSVGFRKSVYALAASQGLSLRQLLYHFGGYGHQIVFGAPEEVADLIEDWFRSGACDGFNLIPDVFPSGLERFVHHVLPLLERRGLFRHPGDDGGTALFGRARAESASAWP